MSEPKMHGSPFEVMDPVKYAEYEIHRLNQTSFDDAKLMHTKVLEIISDLQGCFDDMEITNHILGLAAKAASFQPLSPLTGEDEEWMYLEHMATPDIMWQNRRSTRVFRSEDGTAFDSQGILFQDPADPETLMSHGTLSRTYITFPYTPISQIVTRPPDA